MTLLCLNDQIVYQAIVNFIADKFYRSLRRLYGVRRFGALYAGPSSRFFYISWKKSYRAFNRAITDSYKKGNYVWGFRGKVIAIPKLSRSRFRN